MKNAFGKSPRQANEAENFGLGHLLGEAQENEFDIVLSLDASCGWSTEKEIVTANWDGEKYIARYGAMRWVSEDGEMWRDSCTGELPSSPEFRNCSIMLIGGPFGGEAIV
jgi:hypothetical protein